MANRWGNNGNSDRLYFPGLQNCCRWWLQPWNEKTLALWKKSSDKLSVFKSRDITLLTKVHIVKAMVFPVIMYGSESWNIKRAERQRIDAFELWCWRRLLRVSWTARRSNQSILKEISPEYSLEGLMLKLKLQYFGHSSAKSRFIRKDPNVGKDWRQDEKGMTEDEMVRWHHWLDAHEFEQAPGVGDGQGSLACYSSWGHKESDTTERLNWMSPSSTKIPILKTLNTSELSLILLFFSPVPSNPYPKPLFHHLISSTFS